MVFCRTCDCEVDIDFDESGGVACCTQCGRVVEDGAFASDIQFAKGPDGEGGMVGQFVAEDGRARGVGHYSGGRMWGSGGVDSHEAALSRGKYEVQRITEGLRMMGNEAQTAAMPFYRIALQRGYTRGHRINQVAAVCIYLYCRLEAKPYMLIDFADHLGVNIYQLGSVFVGMLKLLRLETHPTFTKPIDPSLYMNRFVDRLNVGDHKRKEEVKRTATHLLVRMKRDWMLTGRRPSGICGAALFIACHMHGIAKTKREIISVVHIGWATIDLRVRELAATAVAELTVPQIAEDAECDDGATDALLLEYQQKHAAGELDPGMSPEQQKLALALLAAERAGTLSGGSGGMLALPAPGDNEDDEDGGGGKRRRLTNEADEEDEEGGGSKAGAKRSSNGGSDEEEDEEAGDEEVTEGSIVPVENPGQLALMNANAPGMMCEHIQHGAAMFAARMCYSCFHDYVKFTGGGAIGRTGADPPAFKRNQRKEVKLREQERALRELGMLPALEPGKPAPTIHPAQLRRLIAEAHLSKGNLTRLQLGLLGPQETLSIPAPGDDHRMVGLAGEEVDGPTGTGAQEALALLEGPPVQEAAAAGSSGAAPVPLQVPEEDEELDDLEEALGAAELADFTQALPEGTVLPPEQLQAQRKAHAQARAAAAKVAKASAAAEAAVQDDGKAAGRQRGVSGGEVLGAGAGSGTLPSVDDAVADVMHLDAPGEGESTGLDASNPENGEAGCSGAGAEEACGSLRPGASKRLASAAAMGEGCEDSAFKRGRSSGPASSSGLASGSQSAAEDDEADAEDGQAACLTVRPAAFTLPPETEEPDTLSDVDEDDISGYILPKNSAEAKLKDELWTAMNQEWIEKQKLKEAIERASGGAKERKKRGPRKNKALPAHDAGEAAKAMLEQKKLSNKINYAVLDDLFGNNPNPNTSANAGANAQQQDGEAGAGGTGGTSNAAGLWAGGSRGRTALANLFDDDDDVLSAKPQNVTQAFAQKAAQRAKAEAAESSRYAALAAAEERRRVGGGLGGGFLGSLTFASDKRGGGGGGGEEGRARPGGLKPLRRL